MMIGHSELTNIYVFRMCVWAECGQRLKPLLSDEAICMWVCPGGLLAHVASLHSLMDMFSKHEQLGLHSV